jgi:xanthine/uracil permease
MAGSDEQWCRINREGGIAIFIAGSISLNASFLVPLLVHDSSHIVPIRSEILIASILIACGIETVEHWK